MKETKFLGYNISIPEPADPEDALVPEYGRYLDHIKQAEKDFVRTMEKFFNHTLKDEGLEKAAKDWERAGVIVAGYAESLFNAFKDNGARTAGQSYQSSRSTADQPHPAPRPRSGR